MPDTYVKQEGGSHYQTGVPGVSHWDICDKYDVPYLDGCASKYPLRWRSKGGVGDLRKSLTYVDKIMVCGNARADWWENRPRRPVPVGELNALFEAMGTGKIERQIVTLILSDRTYSDLMLAHKLLQQLIAENE